MNSKLTRISLKLDDLFGQKVDMRGIDTPGRADQVSVRKAHLSWCEIVPVSLLCKASELCWAQTCVFSKAPVEV